jgi:hypothetical protein
MSWFLSVIGSRGYTLGPHQHHKHHNCTTLDTLQLLLLCGLPLLWLAFLGWVDAVA